MLTKVVEINVEQNIPRKPRKATRGLGTSKIAKAASSGKLSVIFDADCLQPICTNAERFNNEIGFVVRNHGTFHYKDWRLVPEAVRAPLRHYLLENFDINLSDTTTIKCIDDQMRKAWRNYKFKLHSHFKSIGGENNVEMAKRKRHPDLKDDQQSDWEMLCDRWGTNEFKERAVKNTENYSKKKWASKNGSVSTARHHIRRGMVLTSLTGQIETWRKNHFDQNGWTGPDLQELYDQMVALRNEHTPEELSDKDIMERVLGRRSVYLRGWGRSVRSATRNSNQEHVADPNIPSYQEILQQLNEANNRVREVYDILRYNNLMPPPSTPSTNEASATNLENQDDL